MPGTVPAARRRFSSTTGIFGRSLRGFKTMNMRPVLPPPTNDVTSCTLGSALSTAATRACKSCSAAEEMSSDASVFTWI
ncbi:hypothetical protein D3C81_1828700 [compost metagenome]